jgi:hypothetical protein
MLKAEEELSCSSVEGELNGRIKKEKKTKEKNKTRRAK